MRDAFFAVTIVKSTFALNRTLHAKWELAPRCWFPCGAGASNWECCRYFRELPGRSRTRTFVVSIYSQSWFYPHFGRKIRIAGSIGCRMWLRMGWGQRPTQEG